MIYTIGDLHLSLGSDKPMNIFAGWNNHVERIRENWNSKITENDTVILLGDHSWALKLEESKKDLEFIHKELNGKKILVKGNHDLWWSTMNKITNFVNENGFTSLSFLFNNAYLAEGISICGTRGWIRENKNDEIDVKVLAREAGRLEASLIEGKKLGGEIVAFIHYPPICGTEENVYLTEVLHKYDVKRCYYAHLHGSSIRNALNAERDGVTYELVSADGIGFNPVRVN